MRNLANVNMCIEKPEVLNFTFKTNLDCKRVKENLIRIIPKGELIFNSIDKNKIMIILKTIIDRKDYPFFLELEIAMTLNYEEVLSKKEIKEELDLMSEFYIDELSNLSKNFIESILIVSYSKKYRIFLTKHLIKKQIYNLQEFN